MSRVTTKTALSQSSCEASSANHKSMKCLCLSLLWMVNSLHASEWILDDEIERALAEVNRIRSEADLGPVTVSKELSEGCYNHAKYLVWNRDSPKVRGLDAHKEFRELKGYTQSGEKAGKASVIHFVEPSKAVTGWEATFYHRVPLLQPKLKKIGIAYYEEDSHVVSLIDCTSKVEGRSRREVVFFPADGQSGVPVKMGREIPHPMGAQGDYGFPLTIYFCERQSISEVEVELLLGGEAIDCSVSTPRKPATTFTQWNTICVIAKESLEEDSEYTLKVKCKVDGRKFEETISFDTNLEGSRGKAAGGLPAPLGLANRQHELRTWTSVAGSTIEAKFVRIVAGRITLEKEDGKRIDVLPQQLSEEDQAHLKAVGAMR